MSKSVSPYLLKPLRTEEEVRRAPRDKLGRIISRKCPDPSCDGEYHHEGAGWWRCTGLVDPNDPSKELQACEQVWNDGDVRLTEKREKGKS